MALQMEAGSPIDWSMRTCYLIFCHTDGTAVLRLVRRILELSPSSDVVVRFEDSGFLDPTAVKEVGGIPLVSTIEARWGAWSLVEVMIEVFQFALARTDAQRFVTISGQCYPIRNLSSWERELNAQGVDVILDPIVDHPDDHRYRWSIVTFPRMSPFVRRVVRHLGWRLGRVTHPRLQIFPRFAGGPSERRWWIGVPRKDYSGAAPGAIPIRKASTWLMLSRRAAESVLDQLADDHRLADFFRTVRIPDESTFQSLAKADRELKVQKGVISAKRFPPGESSPVWLNEAELRDHLDTGAPFARKIPPSCDQEVLRLADAAAACNGLGVRTSSRRSDLSEGGAAACRQGTQRTNPET